MAYGMKLVNQDGTTAYDSASPGGVFVRFIVLAVGTSTVQQELDLGSAYRGMILQTYPLSSGDHNYYLTQGNVTSGQNPRLFWANTREILDTSTRKQTILMVFAK